MSKSFVTAAVLALALSAAPASASIIFNLTAPAAAFVPSASYVNQGVTLTAVGKNFTVLPNALTNLSDLFGSPNIYQMKSNIGVDGGADPKQVDTSKAVKEAILFSSSTKLALQSVKLGRVDSDDTLLIYGVNDDDSLTNLGFTGNIVNLSPASVVTAKGISTVTFNTMTPFFSRFVFTTNYDAQNPYSAGYDVRSITAAVPEPASWAMLIVGFAMVGFRTRRVVRHVSA